MRQLIDKHCDQKFDINYLFTNLYKYNLTNMKFTYNDVKIKQKYIAIIEFIFCKLITNSINITYNKLNSLDKNSDMHICQIINRNQLTFLDQDLLLNFENIKKVNLLFQYSCGYFVRESQIKTIDKIKDCLNNNYSHIMQLVMGEGKSTFIIPYICFESVLNYNRSCIILIPNNEKLSIDMNVNLVKILNVFNIKINLYTKFNEHEHILHTNVDIHLMSYNIFKELYYFYTKIHSHIDFINMIKKYFILIDEIDLFLKPNICEMNVVDEGLVYPNKQKLIELFKFIRTKMNTNSNLLKGYFLNNQNKISINDKLAENKFIEFSGYVYNKDYGTNFIVGNVFYLAKPYNYVNNPDLESEFSDFFIKIYTTYFSYYKHKWTTTQSSLLYDIYLVLLTDDNFDRLDILDMFCNKVWKGITEEYGIIDTTKIQNIENNKIKEIIFENFLTKGYKNGQIYYVTQFSYLEKNKISEYMAEIINNIYHSLDEIFVGLKVYVLEFFLMRLFYDNKLLGLPKHIYTVSPYDILPYLDNYVGMTGTPIIHKFSATNIELDNNLGTNYSSYNIITKSNIIAINYDISNNEVINIYHMINGIFNDYLFTNNNNNNNNNNIDGQIDVGY